MKYSTVVVLALLLISGSAFSTIFLDGVETDWADVPVALEAPNNEPGSFPEDVKAAVADQVDVKEVKAKVIDNVIYTHIRFWGGPAWPNTAYLEDRDGVMSVRHRGYYHLGIDLDNDGTTGANSYYYEAHYTPVGFLASLNDPEIVVQNIGAEAAIYWGCDYEWAPEGTDPNDMTVKYIEYAWMDWSDTVWENDDDRSKTIAGVEVPHANHERAMSWDGDMVIGGSEVEVFQNDSTSMFYAGHGWGYDFIEMAFDLAPLQAHFGMDWFSPGAVWGIAPMIETPIDDWAVDETTRGEVVMTEPAADMEFTMDGMEDDWAALPVLLEAPNNEPGSFPEDVKAAVADQVDVKEVKAKIVDDIFFTQIRFWGGPAWPNTAYLEDRDGVMSVRHRGYYHMGIDLDNDGTTGANSYYYEAHYTPVGFLASLNDPEIVVQNIGAEAAIYWGCDYEWAPEGADPDTMTVKYIEYAWMDWSDTKWENDDDRSKTIVGCEAMHPENAKAMAWSGMALIGGSEVDAFQDDTTSTFYAGHGWGEDFIEMAFDLAPLKIHFGEDWFTPGAIFGIAPMIETPIDDWAVDETTRGEVIYGVADAVADHPAVVNKFALHDNYPNPFNPTTNISFVVPNTADVKLSVYNMMGQKVRTLVDKAMTAGSHVVEWNGTNDVGERVSSGLYLYRLEGDFGVKVKKMMLMK